MNVKDKTIFINDNLSVMKGMDSEIFDLVYLDPPFNSNRNYEAPIGTDAYGAKFKYTWTVDDVKNEEPGLLAEAHPELSEYIRSVGKVHSPNMMAYLTMMASRLIEIRRIMKPTASVYLHVNPTASHYLKLIMDSIMGQENFRNEIIWCYSNIGNVPEANFPRKHDVILFYTKTKKSCYNQVFYEHWKSGENVKPCDWWIDITSFNGFMKSRRDEHCGYPTQKPLKLLERIINASSNKGDVVFDPFCGCATTLVAADRLQRQWVGIDISPIAATLVQERIKSEGALITDINVLETLPTLSSEG